MKEEEKNLIINFIPNNRLVKKLLSDFRIKKVSAYLLPEKKITYGESNQKNKKEILSIYKKKLGTRLTSTISSSEKILKLDRFKNYSDKEKKNLQEDMIFCRLAYGFQPDEYLCFELENQTYEERKRWISDIDRYIYIYRMNDIKDVQIFNNKVSTYKVFKKYYGRKAIGIKKIGDYEKFLSFVKEYPVFVKKHAFQGMGRSVELIDIRKISESVERYFKSLIKDGEHIIEEKIEASKEISNLNSSSVNTVRCITFSTKSGIIIPFAFMKIGRKGSFVDNGGAGGILVGIDPATGTFNTDGYNENNIKYVLHPDSGVKLKGYQLPEWQKAISLCKEISEIVPTVRCNGWDLTYTKRGWIIVEGNGMTQFIGPQIVYKKPCKQEVIKIIDNLK